MIISNWKMTLRSPWFIQKNVSVLRVKVHIVACLLSLVLRECYRIDRSGSSHGQIMRLSVDFCRHTTADNVLLPCFMYVFTESNQNRFRALAPPVSPIVSHCRNCCSWCANVLPTAGLSIEWRYFTSSTVEYPDFGRILPEEMKVLYARLPCVTVYIFSNFFWTERSEILIFLG